MKLKKAFFLGHNGLGDNITMIGAINFLLNYFEEIYFLCKNIYQENVKLLYYNKPVIIVPFDTNNEQEECKKIINEAFNSDNNVNIFISGFCHTCYLKSNINHPELLNYTLSNHKYLNNYEHINTFYKDIGLNSNIYFDYFDIISTKLSQHYYNMIKDYNVIFFHTQASNRKINLDHIINQNINDEKTIIICANENIYPNNHHFYTKVNQFINLKIVYYIDIIKNAEEIYCIDSCFSCIVIPLETTKRLKAHTVNIINRD